MITVSHHEIFQSFLEWMGLVLYILVLSSNPASPVLPVVAPDNVRHIGIMYRARRREPQINVIFCIFLEI